uniref:Uncharacterized protein n=1 Tax=Avena sativa TaxID=4498 RepID=A0ACD5U3I2_AVESA
MEAIFSFGLATGRFAMGSSEPLGKPSPEYMHAKDLETLVLDDEADTDAAAGSPSPGIGHDGSTNAYVPGGFDPCKKRKRSLLGKEDVVHITCMTDAVKAVADTITIASPPDVHPALYDAVMDAKGYIPEALMVALRHLLDNRAMGNDFVQMAEDHRDLWLRTFLAKHYYV